MSPLEGSAKLRLAFLGDSITVGDGDAQARGWPSRLCEATSPLPNKMHCYNLGVGGDRIADLAERVKDELERRLKGRTGCGVVIMIGVNDALRAAAKTNGIPLDLKAIESNLLVVLKESRRYGPVLVVEPAPVLAEFEHTDGIEGDVVLKHLEQINDLMARVCLEEGVEVLVLTEKLKNDAEYINALARGDGLHPIAKGFERIAFHLADSVLWSDFLRSSRMNTNIG